MGSFRRLHRSDEKSTRPDLSDPTYLNWVRSLPCAWCSITGPSHPHHSTCHPVTCELCSGPTQTVRGPAPKRGKATKSHDHCSFPLCFKHHRQFHDAAGFCKDWNKAKRREWQEQMVADYHALYFRDGF